MSQAADIRLHVIIRGRVQGVGFREFAAGRARSLGLSGYVRNLPDGRSLEVVAEGPRPALEQLLAFLGRGPRSAHVESVEANWGEAAGRSREFRITW